MYVMLDFSYTLHSGIANLVGNILVALASRKKYDRLALHMSTTLVYGIMTIMITFSVNKVIYWTQPAQAA